MVAFQRKFILSICLAGSIYVLLGTYGPSAMAYPSNRCGLRQNPRFFVEIIDLQRQKSSLLQTSQVREAPLQSLTCSQSAFISKSPNTSISLPSKPSKKGDWETLKVQTLYLNVIFIATNVVLWYLPEELSKWDEEDKEDLSGSWIRNVKEGPVQDQDNFFFNYITHPYAGAAYYMMAKKNGFSWQKSCLYSALVSTFMWEYGWEAFVETPSTLDLWLTPVAGCPLGELFFRWDKAIQRNNGEVFHSQAFGSFIRFSIDPLGYATHFLKNIFSRDVELKLDTSRQGQSWDEKGALSIGWKIVFQF